MKSSDVGGRSYAGRMGKLKQADPLAGINRMVRTWKDAHIAEVRAKLDNKAAREGVKDALTRAGVMHVITPTGVVAMHERSGATKVDWEGLARKHVTADVIERELPAYTSTGEPAVELAAPKEWGVEAKAARD